MTAGGFRPDIDGLRAIAILVVVAFHARVDGFGGGFVGVDVFFVISGWLITRNILRESETTGRVDLLRFWARRIRRLVPGLALVIIATMVGSVLVLSKLEIEEVARQGLAAAFYVSNIFFADQSQGYFATDVSESPFLHTWSLGVEEQFYLFWPVLVGLIVLAARRRPALLRPVLGLVFAALLVTSFIVSRSLTGDSSTWAFYGLPSRIWEFAAAGLLATVGVPAFMTRYGPRLVAGFGGLALLGAATVLHSSSTPYPGTAALLPVVGTLALIVAGDVSGVSPRVTPIGKLLRIDAVQSLGRLSYSWYLWHWPVLILAMVAFDRVDTLFRVAAVTASLPLAWMAYRFVENPVRLSWTFVRPTGRTFLLGAALTSLAAVVAIGSARYVDVRPPTSLELQLEQALDVGPRWPVCEIRTSTAGDDYCEGADLESETLVMLIGDSKALGWFNTVADVAAANHARLVISALAGCPAIDVDVLIGPAIWIENCRDGRAVVDRLMTELQPDLVVLAGGSLYLATGDILLDGEAPDDVVQTALWGDAFSATIREIRARGAEVAVILDNPAYADDPMICIARAGSVDACELSRAESLAMIGPLRESELVVLEELDVAHLDLIAEMCGLDVCDLGTRDYLHYYDATHLSVPSMTAMTPRLTKLVEDALSR